MPSKEYKIIKNDIILTLFTPYSYVNIKLMNRFIAGSPALTAA